MKVLMIKPYRGWATSDRRVEPGEVIVVTKAIANDLISWNVAKAVVKNEPEVEAEDVSEA